MDDLLEIAGKASHARTEAMWTHLHLLGSDVPSTAFSGWLADPEVVMLHSCLGDVDPRIRQEIGGWSARHATLVSLARLSALARASRIHPWDSRAAVESLTGSARAWRGRHRDPLRPELLRLRVRGVTGPGLRAEICLAFARTDSSMTASTVAKLTRFQPQPVKRELDGLSRTGWLRSRVVDGGTEYIAADDLHQLARPMPEHPTIDWCGRLAAIQEIERLCEQLADDPSRGRFLSVAGALGAGAGSAPEFWHEPHAVRGDLEAWVVAELDRRLDQQVDDW